MSFPSYGTSFEPTFTPFVNTNVVPSIGDQNGLLILGRLLNAASLPTDANVYEEGCILIASGAGSAYINSGTSASPTFVKFDTGAGFSLPTTATDSTTTTGTSFAITASAVTTGVVEGITAAAITTGAAYKATLGTSLTTGGAFDAVLGAALTGYGFSATTTGVYTGAGLLQLTASAATTGTLAAISGTGLTSGVVQTLTGGGANMTAGGIVSNVQMGAATVGIGQEILTSGVYTGTGIRVLSATAATTGTLDLVNGAGLTTGIGIQIKATAATLTTGRYISMNDGATEVFGIGTNGHIISTQTTAPTVATNSTGLTAAAVTAGSTDTAGTITTTGTPQSGTVVTLTFNKTYTVAPKVVMYTPANAAAGGVNTMPIVTQTATTAVFTWPGSGTYAATPSFTYAVIA